MNKKEVQQRILQNGKPLSLNKFSWDEKTNTFSTEENYLVIDFNKIDNITFNTGSYCTFNTSFNCTFKTSFNCTFKTGSYCTFNTGSYCTFKTSFNCVIVRRDVFEVITLTEKHNEITLCSSEINGYVRDGKYSETGKNAIIADGILSEIISKRDCKDFTIYKVKNYNQEDETYLIESNGVFSHGKTIKEAKESFIYKINNNRDTTEYKKYNLDTVIDYTKAITMYRTITGACEEGVRNFVESLDNVPKELSIKELIEITKGQYGNQELVKFFN